MSGIELREGGGRAWTALYLQSMGAVGRLDPRLQLYFLAQPGPYTKASVDDVTLRLEHHNELVGTGRVTAVDVHHNDTPVNFEVVTLAPAAPVHHRHAHLQPDCRRLRREAQRGGQLLGGSSVELPGPPPDGQRPGAGDLDPGTWTRFQVSQGSSTSLQLPRSEWFERVLAPTRNEQYLYLEVALAKDHPGLVAEWNRAMGHLRSAERAYAAGNDPGAFQYLRGWLNALAGAKKSILAGAKKNILDAIANEKKRRDSTTC